MARNSYRKYVRSNKVVKYDNDSPDKNEKKFEIDQAYRDRENEVLLYAYYQDE